MDIFWEPDLNKPNVQRKGGNTEEGREGKEKATVEILTLTGYPMTLLCTVIIFFPRVITF